MTSHHLRRVGWGCVVVALVAAGCARQTGRPRVHGRVTFQGQPAVGQTLALFSEGSAGEFFSQKIPLDADGRFTGEVPTPGTYKVAIEEPLAVQEGHKTAAGDRPPIPPKYRKAATSGLVWTIKPGDNERSFELTE
jgi:hypothetical protein